MKKVILCLATFAMFIVGCSKIESEQTQTPISQEKASGLLPDDPALKKNFGFRVSKDFLENGHVLAFNKFGKKIHDLSISDAETLMTAQAKGGTKGGGWGQGGNPGTGSTGGGTSGGGGTITPTPSDYTPPRIIGVDPANGTVLKFVNSVTLSGFIDDETKLARVKITVKGDVILDSIGPFLHGYGNWNVFQIPYSLAYGDGQYDMSWQAWDSTGNTTIVNTVFSRNTNFNPLPSNFPSSYVLPFPPGTYIQQGGEGACAAFAVNSAFTIQKYVRGNQTGGFNGNNVYSPEWIYNIALGGRSCGAGSGILGNMGIVVNRGVPTWNTLPFSSMNGCDTFMFTQAIRDNAVLNKGIYGFSTATADINAIKYNITQGYVGIFSFSLDRQLTYNVPAGYIWNFPHFRDGGPHAGCIVGFDDSKHAFLMLNSWGDTWADQGAVWIDYDFFWSEVSGGLWYFGN